MGLALWAVALVLVATCAHAQAAPLTIEQRIARLPGVGGGLLDTLRRIAGPATVDTMPENMRILCFRTGCLTVAGWYDETENVVHVSDDWRIYARLRLEMLTDPKGRAHPIETATPAGVLAHEFGHRYQWSLWPHGGVREPGDSLPSWAQGSPEVFADRFARVVLAMRGDWTLNWDDLELAHEMWRRLHDER